MAEKPKYDCENCKDQNGYIFRDEEGIERWRKCECIDRKRIEKMMKSSMITDEFSKLSFNNFTIENRPSLVRDAFEASVTYLDDFEHIRNERNNSIAFLGNPGSGKTHLLTAVANDLLKRGISVQYFPWTEGFNDLRNNLSILDEKIHKMQNVSVLFLDDLFKGRKEVTDFQLEQLFAVINYRYLNHKPILVSSEKDIDQMCQIDEALGSRIYQMCKNYTVILRREKGLNYRLEG